MKILTTVGATGKRLDSFQLVLWMVRQLKGGPDRWSGWQDNDAQGGGRSVHVILLQRQHLIRMTPAGFALSVRRRPHPYNVLQSQSLHNKAASAGNCRLAPRFIVIWVHTTIHIWNIISAAQGFKAKTLKVAVVCHYQNNRRKGQSGQVKSDQKWPQCAQVITWLQRFQESSLSNTDWLFEWQDSIFLVLTRVTSA